MPRHRATFPAIFRSSRRINFGAAAPAATSLRIFSRGWGRNPAGQARPARWRGHPAAGGAAAPSTTSPGPLPGGPSRCAALRGGQRGPRARPSPSQIRKKESAGSPSRHRKSPVPKMRSREHERRRSSCSGPGPLVRDGSPESPCAIRSACASPDEGLQVPCHRVRRPDGPDVAGRKRSGGAKAAGRPRADFSAPDSRPRRRRAGAAPNFPRLAAWAWNPQARNRPSIAATMSIERTKRAGLRTRSWNEACVAPGGRPMAAPSPLPTSTAGRPIQDCGSKVQPSTRATGSIPSYRSRPVTFQAASRARVSSGMTRPSCWTAGAQRGGALPGVGPGGPRRIRRREKQRDHRRRAGPGSASPPRRSLRLLRVQHDLRRLPIARLRPHRQPAGQRSLVPLQAASSRVFAHASRLRPPGRPGA